MKQIISFSSLVLTLLISSNSFAAMTCEAICLRKSAGITCDQAVRRIKTLKYEVESREEAAEYLLRDCRYNIYTEAHIKKIFWGPDKIEDCLISYVPSTLNNLKCDTIDQ